MTIWIDAQLSPALADWLRDTFGAEAVAVRDVRLRDATDHDIFMAARAAEAIIVSKDSDFVRLLERYGPPPQVVWITCGNTSNRRLSQILSATWPKAIALLTAGEPLVEISDKFTP